MSRLTTILRRVLPMLAVFGGMLLITQVAEACPNCKNGMSSDAERAKNMAAGYYYSILFMLSMPFLIISSFSGWMYLAVRKAKAEREQQAAAEHSHADAEQTETVSS